MMTRDEVLDYCEQVGSICNWIHRRPLAQALIAHDAEQLANKATAENGVLVKLNDEHKTIIKIQADQIQACESIVKQQEQLGATQDQLSQAVEIELRKVQKELEREKRLSRYKSEAFWMGAMGVLWILN